MEPVPYLLQIALVMGCGKRIRHGASEQRYPRITLALAFDRLHLECRNRIFFLCIF